MISPTSSKRPFRNTPATYFISTLVVARILLSAAAFGADPKPSAATTTTMNQPPNSAVQLLALPDADYFTLSEERELALRFRMAELFIPDPLTLPPGVSQRDESNAFIALGAPRVIDLDEETDLPILLATFEDGQRRWEVKDELNTRILCMNLGTGHVQTEILFVRPKRMLTITPSRQGSAPDAVNAAALYANVRVRPGLRQLLEIPWTPARYALAVIGFDLPSNTVFTELRSAVAKTKEISPQHASAFVRLADAGAQTGRDTASRVTVSLPATVAFKAPLPIQITVGLPRDRVALVPAVAPAGQHLLRMSLLFVQRDVEYPPQIDLAVPANVLTSVEGRQVVHVSFALDACGALPEHTFSGEYQVYLMVGDRIVGPRLLNIAAP